jgi:hypothetical protein
VTAGAPWFWCRLCKEPVRLLGPGLWPESRNAVHAATGQEKGPGHGSGGRHLAVPVDEDPVLRAEADEVEIEFGGVFVLSVRFRIFRAEWAPACAPVGAVHFEARSAAEMRGHLATAIAFARIAVPRAGAVR